MRSLVTFLVVSALVSVALASCPNACSGHGDCKDWDRCTCFKRKDGTTDAENNVVPAWIGPDCSLRTCPYARAWVDIPFFNNTAHRNAECSNAGTCDHKSGNCVCYPGYEGRACDRTVCPNSCSGHGTCQNAATFARDQVDAAGGEPSNVYNSVSAWDSQKMYGCKCESGYRGPDCSMKECPSSADPQGGPDGTTTYLDTDNGGIQRREPRDCSGRGKCDYTSGNCLCFKGFFGEDCSLQTALV